VTRAAWGVRVDAGVLFGSTFCGVPVSMNSSESANHPAPQPAAGTPPAERRFARRIDCAPRVQAAPDAAPAPAPPPHEARS